MSANREPSKKTENPRHRSPSSNTTSKTTTPTSDPSIYQINPDKRTHQAKVSTFLRNAFQNGSIGCDLKLVAENEFILVHWSMMAAHSVLLREQFDKMKPGVAGVEKVEFTKEQVPIIGLRLAINYIYDGEIPMSMKVLKPVYQAAVHLNIGKLKMICEEFLIKSAQNSQDSLHCLSFCFRHYSTITLQCRDDVIMSCCKHYQILKNHKKFPHLHIEVVSNLLSSDFLDATEMDVFESVVQWLKEGGTNFDPRLLYAERILRCVRFTLMTQEELVKCADILTATGLEHAFPSKLRNADWYKNLHKKMRIKSEPSTRSNEVNTPSEMSMDVKLESRSKSESISESVKKQKHPRPPSLVGVLDPSAVPPNAENSGTIFYSAFSTTPEFFSAKSPASVQASSKSSTKSPKQERGRSRTRAKAYSETRSRTPKQERTRAKSFSGKTSPSSKVSEEVKAKEIAMVPDLPPNIPIVIPVYPGQQKLEKSALKKPTYPFIKTGLKQKRKASDLGIDSLIGDAKPNISSGSRYSPFRTGVTDSGTFEIRHTTGQSSPASKGTPKSRMTPRVKEGQQRKPTEHSQGKTPEPVVPIQQQPVSAGSTNKAACQEGKLPPLKPESKNPKTKSPSEKSTPATQKMDKNIETPKVPANRETSASLTSKSNKNVPISPAKVEFINQTVDSIIKYDLKKTNKDGSPLKPKKIDTHKYSDSQKSQKSTRLASKRSSNKEDTAALISEKLSHDGITLACNEVLTVIEQNSKGTGDTIYQNNWQRKGQIKQIYM